MTSRVTVGLEVRAQVVCFDDGRLLSARHEKPDLAYWVLPGGHVEPGETLWAAATRELEEETGVSIEEGRLWAVGELVLEARHVVEVTFLATAWGGMEHDPRPVSGPDGESLVAVAWLSRDRFQQVTFLPSTIARRLREHWDDPDVPPAYLGAAP